MNLEDKVMERLKKVIDPETRVNVVEMELIQDVSVTGEGEVKLKFRPSSFVCPLAFQLAFEIWQNVKEVAGVKGVHLEVVDCLWAKQINKLLEEESESENRKGVDNYADLRL